jgi:replicative DNA helicase
MNIERVPPHSLEAEVGLIGAALLSPDAVLRDFSPDHFYRSAHKAIWQAILVLDREGIEPDVVSVVEELRVRGQLEQVGGGAYVSELSSGGIASTARAEHYAGIIREHARRRLVINAARVAEEQAFSFDSDPLEIVGEFDRATEDDSQGECVPLREALHGVLKDTEEVVTTGKIPGLSTGFANLDHFIRLCSPDLIVVGGRPKMGKTAFSMQLARNVSFAGYKVGVWSLEMTAKQLAARLLCQTCPQTGQRITVSRLRRGDIRSADYTALIGGVGRFSDSAMWIDDTPRVSSAYIREGAKKLRRKHGLDLVVVDYLQRMTEPGRFGTLAEAIGESAKGLKSLAKELDVPVVLVSQIGRSGADNPSSDHHKGSGDIEQEADLSIIIHRREQAEKQDCPPEWIGKAQVIIDLARSGATGIAPMGWDGETTSFYELSEMEIHQLRQSKPKRRS